MRGWMIGLCGLVVSVSACSTALSGGPPPLSQELQVTGTQFKEVAQFTSSDFRAAAAEGVAARTAGRLSPQDRWPECFGDIAGRIDSIKGLAGPGTVGLAVLAMRAHIARSTVAQPMDANCAQVVIDLERDGIRLGLTAIPGGSIGGAALGGLRGLSPVLLGQ